MERNQTAKVIQQWYWECIIRRGNVTLYQFLTSNSSTKLDCFRDFLSRTKSYAHKFDHLLLLLARKSYLDARQADAREHISKSSYELLVEALTLTGGQSTWANQVDFELKQMLESWEHELQSPGFLDARREQLAKATQMQHSVRLGRDSVFIQAMIDKGVFDGVGSYPLSG